jgi:hypothetical protein
MKKRSIFSVLLIISGLTAILTLIFPRLMKGCMEKCQEKMEKEGIKPPEFCKKIMGKYCKPKMEA